MSTGRQYSAGLFVRLAVVCIVASVMVPATGNASGVRDPNLPVFDWPLTRSAGARFVSTRNVPGKVSRAISFAGRRSRVEFVGVLALANQHSFTWSTWAKPALRGSIHPLIERGNGSDVRKSFSFDDSAASNARSVFVRIKARDVSALAVSEAGVWTNNQWTHWSVTYDDAGDRLPRIFRNGVEVAYRLRVPASGPVVDDADAVTALAATPRTAFYHYTGLLDDVRVYGRVLNGAELATLARGASPATTTTAATTNTTTTTNTTATPDSSMSTTVAPATTVGASSSTAPQILFTDVEGGPGTGGPGNLGIPISIFGNGFGPTRGASKVTIGGVEVASYLSWGKANNPGLDMIVVQPGSNVVGGDIVVTVNAAASNGVAFARRVGTIYFIAPTGADTNPCSEARPCATLQRVASNVMRGGDTVLVRGGTYTESEVWIRGDQGGSGSATARKLIKAYPGESVTFANASRPIILNADHITVSGLNLTNGKSLGNGSNEVGQQGNWIINNTFRGTIGYEATGSTGNDHVLAGNVCEVSGSSQGTQGHCFYISFGNNVRLLYNVGSGAPGYGIHVFDQRRRAGDFRRTITNILIEGNTLTGSRRRAGLIVSMGDEDKLGNVIDGVTIRSNTFSGNDQLGAVIGGNVRNVRIQQNNFVQNGNAGLYIGGGRTTDSVDIRDNVFEQAANSVCTIECTWYPLAHVIAEPAATRVVLTSNTYRPANPITVGIADSNPK